MMQMKKITAEFARKDGNSDTFYWSDGDDVWIITEDEVIMSAIEFSVFLSSYSVW